MTRKKLEKVWLKKDKSYQKYLLLAIVRRTSEVPETQSDDTDSESDLENPTDDGNEYKCE